MTNANMGEAIETAPSGRSSQLVVLLLVLCLVGIAGSYIYLPRETANLVALISLGFLAAVGVAVLFALAVGLITFGAVHLVDERKATTEQVFFDSLGDGALVTRADGSPIVANMAYQKLSGAEGPDDLRTVERLFAENPDASEAVYRLTASAEKGRRAGEEIRMPGGIGGRSEGARWYNVKVNPSGPSGQIGWLISDITREREYQENIFQELQNAIDYLDHAPAGFFSLEPDGRIRYINATLAAWIGVDLAEFEPGQLNISEFISVEGLPQLNAASAQRNDAAERLNVDLVHVDGTRIPVRLLHRVPTAADGTVGASRTLVLDMRQGEDAGAGTVAEMRFNRFFNNTPMAIASVDRHGMIGLTNARFVSLFGAAGSDTAKQRLVEVVRQGDRAALGAAIDAAISGQDDIPAVDANFGKEDGRSARFFVSPILEGDAGEDAAIVYALETTEQRELEEQFAQSQKMQAVGQLAGGIAHDFNNVLTAIIGFSDLLLTNHRPSDPSFQDIMNIKQNANRAAGLVRQLLAFSRRQTLRPKVINLRDVLSDLSVLLDRLISERISLHVDHGRDLWPIKADLNQLEQVIVNLAVNARDAMPDGGVLTIRTANVAEAESGRFRGQGFRPGDYVLIEVADTGTGMPPEVHDKIFEPFYSTKDVGKGTGLGLSTVYGIVKQTGGFIYVDSAVGEGTTFRILLPRHVPEETAEEASEEKPKAAPSDLTGNAKILLVEDEEAVRAFAARALTARGYKVYEAATGTEALEVIGNIDDTIDLVVSDVVMPEMDGPTLLRELRKTQPTLKIIFVSGYAEEAFAKHLPEDESFQFLPKPFSLKDLATAVKQTLDG
ncbi:MAG TPA: response regulator [Afifellaceae bacterium]|nr:response regulator [Afifellaceae bacterium]